MVYIGNDYTETQEYTETHVSHNTSRQHSWVTSHSQSGETQNGKGGAGREEAEPLNHSGACLETAPPPLVKWGSHCKTNKTTIATNRVILFRQHVVYSQIKTSLLQLGKWRHDVANKSEVMWLESGNAEI